VYKKSCQNELLKLAFHQFDRDKKEGRKTVKKVYLNMCHILVGSIFVNLDKAQKKVQSVVRKSPIRSIWDWFLKFSGRVP